jgi:hypothetical protein
VHTSGHLKQLTETTASWRAGLKVVRVYLQVSAERFRSQKLDMKQYLSINTLASSLQGRHMQQQYRLATL